MLDYSCTVLQRLGKKKQLSLYVWAKIFEIIKICTITIIISYYSTSLLEILSFLSLYNLVTLRPPYIERMTWHRLSITKSHNLWNCEFQNGWGKGYPGREARCGVRLNLVDSDEHI